MSDTSEVPALLYLDHSVIAREQDWPSIESLIESGKYRLVLSLWNLLELAGATDEAQRERRVNFMKRCKPLWIVDHVHVRKQEIKRFLWKQRYSAPADDLLVITPSLTVVESVHAGPKTRLGISIEQVIKELDTPELKEARKLSQEALLFLQTVKDAEWRSRQKEIFVRGVEHLMPNQDPQDRPLRQLERDELVEYCWDNRDAFFAACPTIAVDEAMCEARISNPQRKPLVSDGVDLAHSVMALAYCDVFVVADAFVRHCAEQVKRRLPGTKLALVIKTVESVPT